jgi:hypothetical protein
MEAFVLEVECGGKGKEEDSIVVWAVAADGRSVCLVVQPDSFAPYFYFPVPDSVSADGAASAAPAVAAQRPFDASTVPSCAF